jgi:hypothetical protein
MSVTQTRSNPTGPAAAAKCWSCQEVAAGTHFCPACGKIQPLPAGADYFAFFDLPQKVTLAPAALETQFHKLSWKLHPDNFCPRERIRAQSFARPLF